MTHIHVNPTSLLGIDQHATVLLEFAAANTHSRAYCAYGSQPIPSDIRNTRRII